MTNPKQYKIAIIEPSLVIREGLKSLLNKNTEFVVQNTYYDIQSFKDNLLEEIPNIILINPAIISFYKPFIIKSLFEDYKKITFVAILYKYINTDVLNNFDGFLDICDETPTILKKLHEAIKRTNSEKEIITDDNSDLSEREKEILTSVALGLTNKEIADKHNISIHTVISHRKNITRKTGIKTVSGLTLYAMLNNLISQDNLK